MQLIQQNTITKKGMTLYIHALRSKSYEDMLHITAEKIFKIIIMNITRDIIIRRMAKKIPHMVFVFFSLCRGQGFPFVKYSNKKGNNTYTQASYDTKSKCIHKTLHFEYFIS